MVRFSAKASQTLRLGEAVAHAYARRDTRVMGGDPVPTFCPLCVSRCGARAEVADGTFLALRPDPSHPTRIVTIRGLGYKFEAPKA